MIKMLCCSSFLCADSEASEGKQTENIPNGGKKKKTASLIQKFLQQTAVIVATFNVNPVFLEDNAEAELLKQPCNKYCTALKIKYLNSLE